MTPNKFPSPEPRIERAPAMEGPAFEQPDFERDGAQRQGEYLENSVVIPGPEMPGHFHNPISNTVSIDGEAKAVERILEEGLDEMYVKMLPADQMKLKQKGEETVSLIVRILAEPKVKIRKIFNLIKVWLKLIPGVNRFFLEQTAKIKTDRIVATISDKKIV